MAVCKTYDQRLEKEPFFLLLLSGMIYIPLRIDSRAVLSLLSAKSLLGMCPASSLEISLRIQGAIV